MARAVKTISTCLGFRNARVVNSFSFSTSSPTSSRNSRRNACSGCSPVSINPPGIPQPVPGRKRCLSNNTRPRASVITAPAVTANRGWLSLTVQRRRDLGARRQIAPSKSFSIRVQHNKDRSDFNPGSQCWSQLREWRRYRTERGPGSPAGQTRWGGGCAGC